MIFGNEYDSLANEDDSLEIELPHHKEVQLMHLLLRYILK